MKWVLVFWLLQGYGAHTQPVVASFETKEACKSAGLTIKNELREEGYTFETRGTSHVVLCLPSRISEKEPQMTQKIWFTYDGENYEVDLRAYDEHSAIRLPDGRVLIVSAWLETFPPTPDGMTEVTNHYGKIIEAKILD